MKKTFIFVVAVITASGCSPKRINLDRYTDEEAALSVARELYESNDYGEAAEAFNYVYLSFDFTRYKSYALFMSGLSYYMDGKYDDAIETFKVFYNKYPSDTLISSTVYYWASSYEKSSPSFERDLLKLKYALETYGLFLARFPSDERTQEAVERVRYCENILLRKLIYEAEVYKKMNRHESAIAVLVTAAGMYPNSDYVSQALYEAALSALKTGDLSNARRYFLDASEYQTEHGEKAREMLSRLPMTESTDSLSPETIEESREE